MKYIGIDYGSARVGLALADDAAKLAARLGTISPAELVATLHEHQPDVVVMGLPRSLDGRETAQTLAVRRYAADVLEPAGYQINFQDEAGTSAVAEERLREAGRAYQRGDIDAEAAAIILQDYLDAL